MHKYLLFLFFVPALLFGGGQKEQNVSASPEDQIVYRIALVDIQVDGQTKPFAIQHEGNITSGTLIYGEENLEAYIAEKRQFLANQRVFENAALEYKLGEPDEHNQIPVDICISVQDSSNFIIFPMPKYDSNEGLSLKLAFRDYNFLGTMTPSELDIGYKLDTDENNGFFLESKIALPFEAAGLRWTLDFTGAFEVMENYPAYYYNDLGLLLDLPVEETTLTFGLYESISLNEKYSPAFSPPDEIEIPQKIPSSESSRDVWYLNTTALARWKIPTGLDVFGLGELEYVPELDFSVNYWPDGGLSDPRRKGFEIMLKQDLAFGKVNWDGNFRNGTTAMLQINNAYNFHSGAWNNALFASAVYHKTFSDWTGFSGRIRWAQWFNNNYYDKAGYILRGVPDENLAADFMLSLNLQESFFLFRFMPSKWFNNPKLRFMDFEEHIAPFIDLALVQDPLRKKSFSFDDMIVTAGLEFTTYPFYFRTVYLRVSAGIDMRELFKNGMDVLSDSNHREFYIGLGHYF